MTTNAASGPHPNQLGKLALTGADVTNEYDFSNAERGRFYRPDALLNPPIHPDPEVLALLATREPVAFR